MVEEIVVPGKTEPDSESLATFLHAPDGISNPGSGERQLAVSDNALVHTAIKASPR